MNSDVLSIRELAEDCGRRVQASEPPAPPIVAIVPSTETTAPFGDPTSMKAVPTALAPNRTPAPIAIVSSSSLRIHSPDRPGLAPSVPPPSARSSCPSTQPKSFAPPAGGPPISYERAFRQWSLPNTTPADSSAPGNLGASVTFQVYTAQDIGTGRPMRSLPAMPLEAKKPNIALRGVAALGAIVLLLTAAAAVVAVSTEDPKRPAPSATTAPLPPPIVTAPEPPPSTISIGDPDPIDERPPTHATAPAATAKRPKQKPKPTSTVPTAPASLKGIAPPPNPYGK